MKRFFSLIVALVALLPFHPVSASVSLDFQAGVISQKTSASDSTPIPVPEGSLGILIADTVGDSFAGTDFALANTVVSTQPNSAPDLGQTLGGYLILRTFTAKDIGGAIGFAENFALPAYSGNFQTGTKFALVWFPSIQTTSTYPLTIGTGVPYGLYRSDTVDTAAGSSIAFIAPADQTTPSLAAFDTTIGGLATPTQLTALRVTAIPEPSSVLMLTAGAALLTGTMIRRRKAA